MDIKLKVSGISEVMAKIRYIAQKVPENGRKKMHALADFLVKEAQLNAPERNGNLVASIRKEVTYGHRGRLQIDIVAGGNALVDRYVVQVHEHYEDMVAPSKYGSGPSGRTYAKRLANPGRYIGEKFLSRAIEDNRERIPAELMQAIMKNIPETL